MTRWFRFYSEALEDPKVQRLDGETFKAWVNLLCLAAKNSGRLPPVEDVAFALRIGADAAQALLDRLFNASLLDRSKSGSGFRYAPHGWQERQYKSDTSTERVKRFRQRSETVTETPPDTETENRIRAEKKEAVASCLKVAFSFDPPLGVSDEQWEAFSGQRKKKLNERSYLLLTNKLIKLSAQGHDPGELIDLAIENGWETVWPPRQQRETPKQYVSASGYAYRGDLDQVQREARRRNDNDTYWQVEVDRKRQAQSAGEAVGEIMRRVANG
jgi:hypothetical protein